MLVRRTNLRHCFYIIFLNPLNRRTNLLAFSFFQSCYFNGRTFARASPDKACHSFIRIKKPRLIVKKKGLTTVPRRPLFYQYRVKKTKNFTGRLGKHFFSHAVNQKQTFFYGWPKLETAVFMYAYYAV